MIEIEDNLVKKLLKKCEEIEPVKPFIRWAGGKQNLVKTLSENIPSANFSTYFEPFLGGGALFLYNNFGKSCLSDINPHLINSYISIRDYTEDIHDRLQYHKKRINPEYYYRIRSIFNKEKNTFNINQAANFIFLVHTSFNGIYRVNKKGEYNVPFGKLTPALPSLEHLKKIQRKLMNTILINNLYDDIIPEIQSNDFVYFDPPYPPLNETSFFQHYSIEKFPVQQQILLADQANQLSKKGVFVMISNAETPIIKKLYKGWNIKIVDTIRYVNCKSERKKVKELIITNY